MSLAGRRHAARRVRVRVLHRRERAPREAPHRRADAARRCRELVGKVDSEALLVHARRATIGKAKDENTHPFRYRRWLFAHDGTIAGFDGVKPTLARARCPTSCGAHIAGDTDSEHAFMHFLKLLKEEGQLDDLDLDAQTRGRARSRGPCGRSRRGRREVGEEKPSRLVFVATNGRVMVATRRGGPLHYALYEGIVPCALDEHRPLDAGERPARRGRTGA